jgi:RHS repeat-associated protein
MRDTQSVDTRWACARVAAALMLWFGVLGAGHAACVYIDDTPSSGKRCANPTVTLSADAGSYVAPTTVTLTAVAKAGAGIVGAKVQKVEFYSGSTLLGTVTAGPWVFSWPRALADVGTYSLSAKVYDKNTLVGQPSDVGVGTSATMVITVYNPPPATTGTPISPPNLAGSLAGSLPGAASVSPSGAASYSIPISAPPGTAGHVPALSLAYSSHGGTATSGVGWGLAGLSSIQRCARSKAVDGERGQVALDANDRYCVDGQRLILVSGTYGANAEYRTEIDAASRITSYGTDASKGPDRWLVEAKDGQRLHFGTTADSYVEAQGTTKPLQWAVSRVEDRKGNYYTVQYAENTTEGGHYPLQVRYTGHTNGLVPYNAIRFEYDTASRPDPVIHYVAGSKTSVLKRLAKISTWINTATDGSGGTLANELRLGYVQSPSGGRSLVERISSCDATGVCLPATSFVWQQHTAAHRNFDATGSGPWGGPDMDWDNETLPSFAEVQSKIVPVDLNGDGRTDLLKSFEDGRWHACLSTGASFDCQIWSGPARLMKHVLTGDFNGDGRTDLLATSTTATWEMCLSTGSAFSCSAWSGVAKSAEPIHTFGASYTYAVGDFTGDGRDDVVVRTVGLCTSLGNGFSCGAFDGRSLFDPYMLNYLEPENQCAIGQSRWKPFSGDFNGDGRADQLQAAYQDPYCAQKWVPSPDNSFSRCIATASGMSCQPVVAGLGKDQGFVHSPGSMIGDLNGDGLQDFVLRLLNGYTKIKFCLSKGNGSFDCRDFVPGNVAATNVTHVGDFDGDGLLETIRSDDGGKLCRYRGGAYQCENWTFNQPSSFSPYYADFNGDGKVDLAHYEKDTGRWNIRLAAGPTPDVLASVTDGVGHVARFTYKPLSDTSVYQADAGTANAAAYPLREVRSGPQVVSQMDADNALGGWLTTTYRYGGNKQDLARGASAGFRWIEATDAVSRVTRRTEYAQSHPYYGMVLREIEPHASGVELRRLENTLSSIGGSAAAAVAGQSIVLPFVSASTETLRELNTGAAYRSSTKSMPVSGGMDGFGNVLSMQSSESAFGETWTTQTTTSYDNLVSTWRIGLPRRTSVTRSDAGVALPSSVTRTVSMDYDAEGLLQRATVEPDTPPLRSETLYLRDDHGNLRTATQSWLDPVSNQSASRLVEDNTWDSKGRFVEIARNALGHAETRVSDARHGRLTSLTGPNQLTTTWQYDGWGRQTRESRADGTATTISYRSCVDTCLNGATHVVIAQTWSGSIQIATPRETFHDRLARPVAERGWAFNGWPTTVLHEHDVNGRLARVSRPHVHGSSAPAWTSFAYDDLGRRTGLTTPTASGGTQTHVFTHDGLRVSHRNPKSQVRTTERNAIGALRSVVDAKGKTTTYDHDPFGNLLRTTDPKGNRVTMGYDRLGRKTSLADPDLGHWTYLVDPVGRTYRQTDAKAQVTHYTHDALDRLRRRLEPDLDSHWVYDSAARGIGKLAEAYTLNGSGTKDYRRVETYDSLARPDSTTTTLDWDYSTSRSYDAYGRLKELRHARNTVGGTGGPANTVRYVYSGNGYLAQLQTVRANGATALEWEVREQDVEHRIRQSALGNGLLTNWTYNDHTGRLASLRAGTSTGSTTDNAGDVQNDAYQYDALGNVEYRAQLNASGALLQEFYTYDELNRLKTSQVSGQALKSYDYDDLGNLVSATGVGTYTYPASGAASVRPHAVSAITGSVAGVSNPSFTYDANGNLQSGAGRSYTLKSFNLPASVSYTRALPAASTVSDAFVYGPEHQRVRQDVSVVSGSAPVGASTTWYAGAIEKERTATQTKLRTYLPMGLGFLEEVIDGTAVAASASAPVAPRYFHHDHLGSVIAVSDAAGGVLQRLSYDAWGKRRQPSGADEAGATLVGQADRSGYTGHEHLDAVALIHMNGRLYDPLIGRFVSADPTVPSASDGQALNRYAYVLNNPLALVDPSGYGPKPGPTFDRYDPTPTMGEAKELLPNEVEKGAAKREGNANAGAQGESKADLGRVVIQAKRENPNGGMAGRLWGATRAAVPIGARMVQRRVVYAAVAGVGLNALPPGVGQAAYGVVIVGGLWLGVRDAYNLLATVLQNANVSADQGGNAEVALGADSGNRFPDRNLPRDEHGNPVPDPEAEGPHTQLGQKDGRKGRYDQGREFDANGKPVRDIDFTDHGRPGSHPNPHQHDYLPNPTGGTPQRGATKPLGGS